MEKIKTVERLKALVDGADGRSESARLADVIDDVENALKAGVKRQVVLDTLHQCYGFKMKMSGFEKALRKLRKKNEKSSTAITANHLKIAENTKQGSSERFITPQERKNFGKNALKVIDDEETYMEE